MGVRPRWRGGIAPMGIAARRPLEDVAHVADVATERAPLKAAVAVAEAGTLLLGPLALLGLPIEADDVPAGLPEKREVEGAFVFLHGLRSPSRRGCRSASRCTGSSQSNRGRPDGGPIARACRGIGPARRGGTSGLLGFGLRILGRVRELDAPPVCRLAFAVSAERNRI